MAALVRETILIVICTMAKDTDPEERLPGLESWL